MASNKLKIEKQFIVQQKVFWVKFVTDFFKLPNFVWIKK